ncbi:MAG: restriction endonuclease, partial [Planctomycetes bacterium]|nr:restriction endonuclease [Planctomycetota bacterium]
MKELPLYKKYLNTTTVGEIIKKFQDTLLESNMTFSYFCDWGKIKKHVDKYTYEINILNYLVGAVNVKEKLNEILKKNPET